MNLGLGGFKPFTTKFQASTACGVESGPKLGARRQQHFNFSWARKSAYRGKALRHTSQLQRAGRRLRKARVAFTKAASRVMRKCSYLNRGKINYDNYSNKNKRRSDAGGTRWANTCARENDARIESVVQSENSTIVINRPCSIVVHVLSQIGPQLVPKLAELISQLSS